MRPHACGRLAVPLALAVLAGAGCGRPEAPSAPSPAQQSSRSVAPRQVNREAMGDFLGHHLRGLAYMEQFEYGKAAEEFRTVHQLSPDWVPGTINLAIALLNKTGEEAEKAKKSGQSVATSGYDEALELLESVIDHDPQNPYAHYCRGILLYQTSPDRISEAHREFLKVTEIDPDDGHTWYWVGRTLTDPNRLGQPAGLSQANELIKIFSKAVECNPYLVSAIYQLQLKYAWAHQPGKQKELIKRFENLNPDREISPGTGEIAGIAYESMGKYATVIDPLEKVREGQYPFVSPRFDAPAALKVKLAEGDHWVKAVDFTGPLELVGRARARFGAPVAVFDADGDGKLDLFLAAAVHGAAGVRDALLINKGDGSFEDATLALGLPKDRASLGVAAADFDADLHIDLFLTGVGDNRLFRNQGKQGFEDISKSLPTVGAPAVSLTARWLDLDQDGDLDLYVVNYTSADHAAEAFTDKMPPGAPNAVYRNDGQPPAGDKSSSKASWTPIATATPDVKTSGGLSIALTPWTGVDDLLAGSVAHTGIAMLDVDSDHDLDLVLSADGAPATVVLNDRMGQFHASALKELKGDEPGSGLLVIDLDRDGRTDLAEVHAAGKVVLWRNATEPRGQKTELKFESWPTDATQWRTASATDLDLDGWPDLVGLPAGSETPAPVWARNETKRLVKKEVALGPDPDGGLALAGIALADLVGDPLPDLLMVCDGQAPRLAQNKGNGQHWQVFDLGGRWHVKHEFSRTNAHAIGTWLALEGLELSVPYLHTTPSSSLAQSIQPIVLGRGKHTSETILRLRWPDNVMQCELDIHPDERLALAEKNRKTGSCPVLFTWNGERFVCLGDFLGGGGLGYLVAPGVVSQPDRDEAVAIAPEQLKPIDDKFRMAITEPMDEVAYLEQLELEVVDRPPGVSVALDERFVPEGPRPTGQLLAWKTAIEPVRATSLDGQDLTDVLRAWDRRTADGFKTLKGWVGYAEEHGIVLDFGDRLSRFTHKDHLVLCLAGWVEYPYSQTNYAAATAGVALKPPAVERRREDGSWETIEPHAGYPAGLPRMTTLDLTGKLTGPNSVIRLKTNMECYWDQAFVALVEDHAAVQTHKLPVARAVLGYRGYTREVSPDGKQPLLYDYDYVDPAPLASLAGRLTRYGDVASLLQRDDDQLCILGPGDEVGLEFEAGSLPALPAGWTRSYVLRAVGYCKDADPFTASSDTVGPLPWKGMPAYPFGAEGERPQDPEYRAYLERYQTRAARR